MWRAVCAENFCGTYRHHADAGQPVRGVIVAKEISEDLRIACSEVPSVSLFEYELSVSLKQVALGN